MALKRDKKKEEVKKKAEPALKEIVVKATKEKEKANGDPYLRVKDTADVWYSAWHAGDFEIFEQSKATGEAVAVEIESKKSDDGKRTFRNISVVEENDAESKQADRPDPDGIGDDSEENPQDPLGKEDSDIPQTPPRAVTPPKTNGNGIGNKAEYFNARAILEDKRYRELDILKRRDFYAQCSLKAAVELWRDKAGSTPIKVNAQVCQSAKVFSILLVTMNKAVSVEIKKMQNGGSEAEELKGLPAVPGITTPPDKGEPGDRDARTGLDIQLRKAVIAMIEMLWVEQKQPPADLGPYVYKMIGVKQFKLKASLDQLKAVRDALEPGED